MTVEGDESSAEVAETTIVYVDDDAVAADEVVGALRDELPAAAIHHVDGAAQLLQNGLEDVDCLVSADQLAETPGVNLVRAVREVSADVPVLLYGAPETPAEITAAFDAGATDYLQHVGEGAPTALARKVAAIVGVAEQTPGADEDAAAEVARPPAESLQAKEYRVIAEVASDAIVTIDERSRIHYANPAVEEVFGYDPQEIVGEPLTTLMPDEMAEPHLEGLDRYLETGERALDWSYLELPGERKDGTEIPLSVSFGEFERDGRRFFSGIMRDVSERRALEEDLREERNLNRRIVETSPIGIVTLDADGRFTSVNERAEEILGRSKERIDGTTYDDSDWDLVDPEGTPLPSDRTPFAQVVENGEAAYNVEFGIRRPGGERAWLSVSGEPLTEDGEVTGAVLAIDDVTERRTLEGDLREERDLNRRIVETSPVGIMIADRNGAITFANEHAGRILDADPDSIESVSTSISELDVVGPDGEALPEREIPFRRVLETGEAVYEVEIGIQTADDERVWILLNAAPMFGDDGDVADVVFAFQDVTERRRLAGELREVYGRVTDAFYALDDEFRITHANDRAEELIDYRGEGLVGTHIWDVFEWGEDSKLGEEYREAMASQEPTSFELYYPEPLDAWYEISAYPSETGLSVYFRDVTERKERERELELFRTLLDNTTDSILVIDPHSGEFLDANETACRRLGYDRDELIGLSVPEIDRVFDASEDWSSHVEEVKNEGGMTIEGVHERKDGTTYPAEVNVTYVELDREYMVAVARDITERKQRERELEESRQRYQTLVENFPNGAVALVDQSLRYVTFGGTPVAEDTSIEDLEGEYLPDALPDELADAVVPGYEAALEGETVRYEETVGEGVYQFHFIPVRDDDGDVFAAIGMSQDVTERREHRRALRRERDFNEQIVETSPVGIVSIEADGTIDLVNERAEEILGRSATEFEELAGGTEELTLLDGDGEPLADEDVPTSRVLDGETVHDRVIGLQQLDGETVWISVNGTPMRDDGTVTGALLTFADVTERRERERELEEHERQLERHARYTDDVLDAVDDVFYVLDEDGEFQRWNESLTAVTGYSDAEIQPMRAPELFRDEDREIIAGSIEECFETGSVQVEMPFLTKSGEIVPYEFVATTLETPDGKPVIAGIGRDITERRERERQLEAFVQQQHALSQLRRKALEDIELDELFDETVKRVADVLGHEYAKVLELQEGGDELLLRSGVGWDEGIEGTATVDTRENSQAGYTLQESGPVVVEDLDAETRFTGPELLTSHDVSGGISVIIGPRDNPWGVLGTHTTERRSYADHEVEFVQHAADMLATAVERERHDQQIAALSNVTRVFMEVESPEAVCDIVADAADGDLELPIASVALYDEASGQLRPAAATTLGEQLFAETELFDVASGLAWEAFVNDEYRADVLDRRIALPAEPVHLRERIALPLGKHGVLLVGVAGEGTMPDPQLDFVETVAATVRAALDRADREATLRDREAALQRQNEDLERLARLNEVVRGIEQVLVGASTRSEIESAVCEQLATVEPYQLAWIGRPDAAGGLRRVAAAGETGYLDDVELGASADDDPEPSLAAADAGEVRVAERVHAEPPLSGWRQAALRDGFSSAVAVPIEYGGYRYGVLTVYGDRSSLFDGRERETLVDLSDTIAYAINAVESKRALVGDEVVELELELYDPDAFVFQFLAESGGRFEFENVFLQDGRGLRTLFSATDLTPEEIRDYAERSPFIEELRQITDDDPPLFESVLTENGFIPRLFDHGARPQQISATGEGARLVVELSATVDVRGFVEMLQTLFERVELLARRERTLETRSRREFQAELDAELTDRQREVLRAAYFGGFFETPRQRTGEEIGASLDISQPTFNHHLRAAQRKLFELLYGSADADAESE